MNYIITQKYLFFQADSPAPGEQAGGQIPALFSTIEKIINPELVKKTQAIYQFNVKGVYLFAMSISKNIFTNILFLGNEEGVWFLDLKNGDGSCGKGEPQVPADATLTMDSKNFHDMFSGDYF